MSYFTDKKEFFVGIDSDGCAFDTMELKHRKVFIPQAIASLGFQSISESYRKTAETVNLYSRSRGLGRFEALAICLDRMRSIDALAPFVPSPEPLLAFVNSGTPLSNDALAEYIGEDGPEILQKALHWSRESDRKIAKVVVNNPPFSGVQTTLSFAHTFANTMIVSVSPAAALQQEWGAAGFLDDIDLVAGQEFGPKKAQLAAALSEGFEPTKALMVGDAPGDHAAAKSHGILFFPIVPGREEESWQNLERDGLTRFRQGRFSGRYQEEILDEYYAALDSHSPGLESSQELTPPAG